MAFSFVVIPLYCGKDVGNGVSFFLPSCSSFNSWHFSLSLVTNSVQILIPWLAENLDIWNQLKKIDIWLNSLITMPLIHEIFFLQVQDLQVLKWLSNFTYFTWNIIFFLHCKKELWSGKTDLKKHGNFSFRFSKPKLCWWFCDLHI